MPEREKRYRDMNAKEIIRNVQADLVKIANRPEKFGISEEFDFLMPQLLRAHKVLLDRAIFLIESEKKGATT